MVPIPDHLFQSAHPQRSSIGGSRLLQRPDNAEADIFTPRWRGDLNSDGHFTFAQEKHGYNPQACNGDRLRQHTDVNAGSSDSEIGLRGLRQTAFRGTGRCLKYVARYTHRVAISNDRVLDINGGKVAFRWRRLSRWQPAQDHDASAIAPQRIGKTVEVSPTRP
jgi:hypothetical protein